MLIENHLKYLWNKSPKIIKSLMFEIPHEFCCKPCELDGTINSRLPTVTFARSILLGGLKAVNTLALRSEFNTPDETFPLLAHRRK